MIVSLCARVFDPDGALVFEIDPASDLGESSRRVSRVKTLDGFSAFSDNGYSDGDRTITLKFVSTVDLFDQLHAMMVIHPLLSLATIDGCFEGVAETITRDPASGIVELVFLVGQRLDDA